MLPPLMCGCSAAVLKVVYKIVQMYNKFFYIAKYKVKKFLKLFVCFDSLGFGFVELKKPRTCVVRGLHGWCLDLPV